MDSEKATNKSMLGFLLHLSAKPEVKRMPMRPCTPRPEKRPFTGSISAANASSILLGAPITVGDHLLHAWEALEAASRGDRPLAQVSYAKHRAACVDALLPTLRGKALADATAELALLRDEFRYAD